MHFTVSPAEEQWWWQKMDVCMLFFCLAEACIYAARTAAAAVSS